MGVLKVLEEMRVLIDMIAGTSMGAIVGGLYAAGMSADELERELLAVRWSDVFANRIERPLLFAAAQGGGLRNPALDRGRLSRR